MRRHSPALALTLLTAIGTIGFVDRIVVNALVEPLKAEFDLSDAQIGLLGFAYAALNIVVGVFIARYAERGRRLTLTAIGTVLWSIAAAASGMVQGWGQLLAARIAVGIGEAVGLPANQSVISDYYPPHRRASAMSIMLLAPPFGAFIGLAGGAWIAQELGWRWAFILTAIPGVFLGIIVWLFVKEPRRGAHDGIVDDAVPPMGAVLRRFAELRSVRHILSGYILATIAGFGVNGFFTALLMRKFDLPIAQAGLATGLIASLPAAASIVAGGFLADRIAHRVPSAPALVPAVSLLIAGPLFAFAITRGDLTVLLAAISISVLFQFSYLGVTAGLLQNIMHPRMRATGHALVNILSGLAGGLGPVAIGWASDRLAATGLSAGVALGWAMAGAGVVYLWASLHYFIGARRVAADLSAVRSGAV